MNIWWENCKERVDLTPMPANASAADIEYYSSRGSGPRSLVIRRTTCAQLWRWRQAWRPWGLPGTCCRESAEMQYSRFNQRTGLYEYFADDATLAVNSDLPVPSLRAVGRVGVPSLHAGAISRRSSPRRTRLARGGPRGTTEPWWHRRGECRLGCDLGERTAGGSGCSPARRPCGSFGGSDGGVVVPGTRQHCAEQVAADRGLGSTRAVSQGVP